MQRLRVLISGKVTGIFFRRFIWEHAVKLGIKGWVRNIGNEVEAVFEGNEEQINKILEYCKIGPSSGRVDNIKIKKEKLENLKDFKILY